MMALPKMWTTMPSTMVIGLQMPMMKLVENRMAVRDGFCARGRLRGVGAFSECGYTAGGDYDALALMATWPVEKYAARHGVDVVKAWEWLLDLYVIIGLDFSGG